MRMEARANSWNKIAVNTERKKNKELQSRIRSLEEELLQLKRGHEKAEHTITDLMNHFYYK